MCSCVLIIDLLVVLSRYSVLLFIHSLGKLLIQLLTTFLHLLLAMLVLIYFFQFMFLDKQLYVGASVVIRI